MTQEETQKQIEAVRGLIELYDHVTTKGNPKEWLARDMYEHLSTLTKILKPYLNGEKLEV